MKKLKKTKKIKKKRLALAWYKPGQWDRLREISKDSHVLEETYEEWRSFAEKFAKDNAKRNMILEKVEVDVDELLAWCQERNVPVDSESRCLYAA